MLEFMINESIKLSECAFLLSPHLFNSGHSIEKNESFSLNTIDSDIPKMRVQTLPGKPKSNVSCFCLLFSSIELF